MEMSFWGYIHEEFRELVKERGLARQRGEPVPPRYEVKCIAKNGEVKWVLVSAGRIEYKGTPAVIATLFDITDRKRMEDELRQAHDGLEKRVEERTREFLKANEQLQHANRELAREVEARKAAVEVSIQSISLLKATLESTADGILVVDNGGRIIDFNERFLELWHITRDVIVSLDDERALTYLMEQLINPEDFVARVRELHGQLGEERLAVTNFRDGRVFEWYSRPQRVDNEIVGRVWSFRDITDRKRDEDALRESETLLRRKKELLEEMNRTLEMRVHEEVDKNREKDMILIHQNRQAALGEILDHIAHQWKQPLNILNLIMYDMEYTHSRGKLTDEQVSKTLDNVTALTENMSQTINVFRDFYKQDREKTLFSISESIDSALTFITPALRYDAIEVELDADPELSAIGYPKEYAQVFINIMTNARDALRERGAENPRIKIRAFADDNKAIVDITDNAGGIPERYIDKIFDLYFTTKGASGGTGIGLYMSKKIIEKNMGGTLSVCNVEQGAQFRIALETSMDIEVYKNSLPC
jgi:PAS domain S-box-containing protein